MLLVLSSLVSRLLGFAVPAYSGDTDGRWHPTSAHHTCGHPARDPLFSLAFTACLGPLLRQLPQGVTPLAFADDVMLIRSRASVLDGFCFWQLTVQGVSLSLSVQKAAVWDPRADPAFLAWFTETYPGSVVSPDGVTIRGLPAAEPGAHEIDWAPAWRDDPFGAAFLVLAKRIWTAICRPLPNS